MSEAAAWTGLLEDLYASILDPEAATRLSGRFNALVGGVIANVWSLDARTLAVKGDVVTNLPPEVLRAYSETYYRHDPWALVVRQARLNVVLHGSEIVSDTELARSLYYNEFAMPHGMFHLLGALVPVTPGRSDTFGAVSILRSRDAGAFDSRDAEFLGRALPHIAGAFRLRGQVAEATAALRAEALGAALELLGTAVLVLDGQCTVLALNARAEVLPVVRSTLSQRTNPHRTFRVPGQERLTALVASAAKGGAGGELRLVHGAKSYLATISPLPRTLAALIGREGQTLLLLKDLADADKPLLEARTTALFGLTAAEAAAATALARGFSPAEIAAARGVKVSTVRTQLQRTQDKVGCHTLRDLVRLLVSLG